MDKTRLEVGKYVRLSGFGGYTFGEVIAITPSGVDVDCGEPLGLLSFDNNGVETDDSRRRRLGIYPEAALFPGVPPLSICRTRLTKRATRKRSLVGCQ
jgi:hypothetical protein